MTMSTRLFILTTALILPLTGAPRAAEPGTAQVAAFEELAQSLQRASGAASDEQMLKLLELSQQLGRPFQVSTIVKTYLGQNPNPPAAIVLLAADNAWASGEYRGAVARYKAYLRSVDAGREASEAAARMYGIMIDYLGDKEDAWQFMREFGDNLRHSPAARRFDGWYLAEARARKDQVAMVRRLAAAFGDKLPLEQERFYYWDHLDWALSELSRAGDEQFEALPDLRRLAGQIRENRPRSLKTAFYAANLGFKAGRAGKTAEALARDFRPVAAAARAWFDAAPTAETLQTICAVFFGGEDVFNEREWQQAESLKREFFIEAFDKLRTDEDRLAMLTWQHGRPVQSHLASPEQWSDMAMRHARLFQNADAVRHVVFGVGGRDAEALQKLAQQLKGVPNRSAAIIGALAAGDDLARGLRALVRDDAWHLEASEMNELLNNALWPAFRARYGADETRGADDYFRRSVVQAGEELIARTPVALLDPRLVRAYVEWAWRHAGEHEFDKTRMVEVLRSLEWVPYTERERKDIFETVNRDFRNWAGSVRRSNDQRAKAAVETIGPLDQAFKAVMDGRGDPAKGPTPLCQKLAEAHLAARNRNAGQFRAAAHEVYALVKDFDAKRTPFGRSALEHVVRSAAAAGASDFQVEVLADVMAQDSPATRGTRLRAVANAILGSRSIRDWREFDRNDQALALKFNEVFAKTALAQIDRNQFDPFVFELFRATRRGNRWSEPGAGLDVMERLLQKKTLSSTAWRPSPGAHSATVSYMWLIANEFPRLRDKYPLETWFDDMFVEEALKSGYLDAAYWQFGRDTQRKIVNAAARVLAQLDSAPLGYDERAPAYTRELFLDWHARALNANPELRDALIAKAESAWGKTRFDEYAMGRAWFTIMAGAPQPPARKEYFDKLDAYLKRLQTVPARLMPPTLAHLERVVKPAELTDAELAVLTDIVLKSAPATWWRGWNFEALPAMLQTGLMSRERAAELVGLAPHFWKIARDTGNIQVQRALAQFADAQLKAKRFDLATVYSVAGIEVSGSTLPDDARTSLVAVRSQAIVNIGGKIPVDRSDPRYPVFVAQSAYTSGSVQLAWETYAPHAAVARGMIKELDPRFLIWLINQNAVRHDFDEAEALSRQMLMWADSAGGTIDPEVRAQLLIAYANISFERKEYTRARAQFERIVAAEEFAGTRAREQAELRVAEVDRLTRQYDKAVEILERLTRRKDRDIQTEAWFQLAKLKFEQEDYPEARSHLEQVFLRASDHADGRILEGNLDLRQKRLIEATEVKVGLTAAQRVIVPGRPLRVRLEDQTLAVVGKAESIEIRVWTSSGDDEIINLVPFGDSRTKFEASIGTELAPVKKADRLLQVLGNDTIYYDFSERFKQAHKILSEPFTLTVATDAELYWSSGRILTREEIAERQMEQLLRDRLGLKPDEQPERVALSLVRPPDQIKPGNNINVRVVDPDRSITPQRDKLTVRVAASSGDLISAFELLETDTHSGIFEGAIPTASAQATAYATNTEEGRSPNFPISAGNHPAWVALPDNLRPKLFSVDLNDNVPLGSLSIRADEPGRRLQRFHVQTSLNGRDFHTVGSWPEKFQPWDGRLKLDLVKLGARRGAWRLPEVKQYLQQGHLLAGERIATTHPDSLSVTLDRGLAGQADRLRIGDADFYVARLQGAFYLPARQNRAFRLNTRDSDPNAQFFLVIDGELAGGGGRTGLPMEIRRSFAKGVHRLEVYVLAQRTMSTRFDVEWDIDEAPFMGVCPVEMFDPAAHPDIAREVAIATAEITPGDKQTSFEVAFGAGARARVVRLVLEDFETDAPAISRITLTDAEGRQVLPTQQDLTTLKQNQVLEIIPGDKITITYEDPKTITPGRNVLQGHLTATYYNATVTACFPEYQLVGGGQRRASYVPIRRFNPGDAVAVVIVDPDMDATEAQDKVSFTAKTTGGQPVRLEALETENHSGVFVGNIFPVTTKPQRPTELQVRESDDITIVYLDRENTDPGVAWDRSVTIEQAIWVDPQLRLYDVSSVPLPETETRPAAARPAATASLTDEYFPATRMLLASRPAEPAGELSAHALMDGPLLVEVLFPTIALSSRSTATLYAQTSSGRDKHGQPLAEPFDITVPGTIKVVTGPSGPSAGSATGSGYASITIKGDPEAISPLDDGRFTFNLPVRLGEVPDRSLVPDQEAGLKGGEKPALLVRGGDKLFVGFMYTDPDGATRWLTGSMRLSSDVFFDVMDRRYQELISGAYVGETLYFRVVHKEKHVTPEKDEVPLTLTASSGHTRTITLMETFGDTGVFKGLVTLTHADDPVGPGDTLKMPVNYGDTITIGYQPWPDSAPLTRTVLVHKGADGTVAPFTKRFKDEEIAVQTQFTMAEALFELAKKHRELGEESLARRQIAQGKKVLEEAIRDYPDTQFKAQADYLLANLSLEFANIAVDEAAQKQHYLEAIGRFTDIVASWPDSTYAPKAQFKKALTFEKMGEIDQACEEYVKLSYRYPDNELVAETIARLGHYFFTKARQFTETAEQQPTPLEKERVLMEARTMFTTAAEVFGRLAVRFPTHQLAGRTTMLSAQCYMRAENYPKAVEVFQLVTEDANADKAVRAEAMYWCGDAYMKMAAASTGGRATGPRPTADPVVEAYRMFTRLRWEYPESTWARHARGRLSEPSLAGVAKTDQTR
jgi:tetratricopeptide (TPR) repeat protein